MEFKFQQNAITNLHILADNRRHGVIIVGNSGIGKTYLAKRYANFLGIPDFYIINPVMSDIRDMIDFCVESSTPTVMCLENLDSGVVQSSYVLLKLIEDCPSHLYIVVTCNNLFGIPDTIPSRCAIVTINPPTKSDINQYAISKDPTAYEFLKDKKIWKCIGGFGDADVVLKFTPEHLKYFESLEQIAWHKDSVSNISWKLQHYEDKAETPLPLVIRYLMQNVCQTYRKAYIDCLNDLNENRISKNAIVSRLVFELKYTE